MGQGSIKLSTRLSSKGGAALYEVPASGTAPVRRFVFSSEESRRICNDTLLAGVEYTAALRRACGQALEMLQQSGAFGLQESSTSVLHILRGGLNFGLREALHDSLGWNRHSSAFISAQRARRGAGVDEWVITENSYKKVHFHGESSIVLGDVVATGTSLEYALRAIGEIARSQGARISNLLFFTIGGPRSHAILASTAAEYSRLFGQFGRAVVVYLEGIFTVAGPGTPLRIKLDGTDLLRGGSVLAPEFIESQYSNPAFPIERCTIYDAGSRAFDVPHYLEDVSDYWTQVRELAVSGVSYREYLAERMPELDPGRFGDVSLKSVADSQLEGAR